MSPYAIPHKGLRHALAVFQRLAGATRYDDGEEVARLRERGAELDLLLRHHLLAEDRYFLTPLAERDPEAAQRDRADHAELERSQEGLFAALARLDGTVDAGRAFYLQVTSFHAAYLDHVRHEEEATEPAMFAVFTPEEIDGFSAAIFAHAAPEVLLASMRYILPALPRGDAEAMLARLSTLPFADRLMGLLRTDAAESAAAYRF